jgi:hypothetical protein
VLTQPLRHRSRIHAAAGCQQFDQNRRHTRLALAGRQVQNPQVLLGRPRRLLPTQLVVSHAKVTAGKQFVPVAVIGERSRLADQPVDDVPVVDPLLATPTQTRHLVPQLLGVPHLNHLGVQACLHFLADEPAGHRVDVPLHLDNAARFHAHPQPLARLQAVTRQRSQQRHFFRQTAGSSGVLLREHLPQEVQVVLPAAEVAAAAHHQRLVHGALELVVALLGIAVLVALAGLDGLALQAVVGQQRLVALLERLRPFDARLHGRGQPISPMQLRHAAQFPQGVLQAFAEALQALRKTDRSRLPIGVGENEMIDQVVERNALDGHVQVGAVGEIAGRQPTGVMHLGEENLLGGSALGAPDLDPALQGAQLAVGEASGEASLQVGEKGLGLQSGVELQLGFEFGPDLDEGVRACSPVPVHARDLAGQLAEAAILARRLGIHADSGGRHFFGNSLPVEATEDPHLLIGDHRKPP